MRNRVFVAVLLLLAGTGLAWSQFWKDMGASERQTLGESYWLAGDRYEAVGKVEKGREHKALARLIWPDLDPAAITESDQPSAAELLASGRARPLGAAADAATPALNSFFLRFVGALLDEDATAVAGFLDGSVYLSSVPVEMTRGQARDQLAAMFDEVSLAGYTPSSVYDLDSIVISPAPPAVAASVGEAYTLRVDARADFSSALAFWEERQQYFVRRAPEGWSIFAIGRSAPPAGWRPRQAPAVEAATVVVSDAEASEAIVDAFTGCLSAFLAENADGALAFMADEVTFLRLRQTVTRDELSTTFLGYFETTDFGGAGVDDVVDTAAIFVEPADSPVDGVNGRVYRLNAEALVDLSATIPFLGKYQRYYFREEAGDWKIFAIL
jgi:hypothetical protein